MYMKLLNKLIYASCLLFTLASCDKEDDLAVRQPVGLGGDSTARGPIDTWLLDSLTRPYNIAVKYRWDPWELNLSNTLTPPDESKIVEAMAAVKRVWIDPYNAETGSELFIKRFSPKQFVLVGSVEYLPNGTVTLGQAEGGNTITFFDINQNFDQNKVSSLRRMIQTSHHEFAHILHQNVMYPQEYKSISSTLGLTGYTSTWFNVFPDEALEEGYITPYAMASPDEDFVEMIANMLVEGKTRFDELVASTNATAQQSLRQKEQIVVDYFSKVWNIDFYSLQKRVQTALNALVPTPPINEAYGFGKSFTTATAFTGNQAFLPQSATFQNLYNQSRNEVAALPYGIVMDSIALLNGAANATILRVFLSRDGDVFLADFLHSATNNNGVYSFTLTGADDNGQLIADAVAPLLDYFADYQFAVSWFADPSVSIYPRARFTPQSRPNAFFTARLLP